MLQVKERRWTLAEPEDALVAELAERCSISPLLAGLLANRGIRDAEGARRFLNPNLSDLHDPFLLLDMEAAVQRLVTAVAGRERICIYGDYDADGLTSVAVLAGFLLKLGADCFYHIPHRIEEGYGLSLDGIRAAAARGAGVIVTADCGITAFEEADLCAGLGIDLIITDHHTPSDQVPKALAVINPLREGDAFPCKALAGVGVVFNLLVALRMRLRDNGFFLESPEPNLRECLDLVALGTIADIVPLVSENRILVSYGLRELTAGSRVGIRELKKVSGINDAVDCGAVGFRLAPRLNAAGRLDDASLGAELLLTGDERMAASLAGMLDASNGERQTLELEILHDAVRMVENDPLMVDRRSIVLASDSWHAGVIGIVASRLVELYHRPTILISLQDGNGKGSGRSIPGFHLHEALKECAGQLTGFGGHKHAAGLTIDESFLDEFADRFDMIAAGLIPPEELVPEIRIDAELAPVDATLDTVELLDSLGPFGMGNPRPVFAMRGVEILQTSLVKERHVRMRLSAGGTVFEAMGFGMAGRVPAVERIDIAFCLDCNQWKGRRSLRLMLKDLRVSC
ncbi:MAG: single-stranded-DNA-specific exonuclease RecJ [Geobacteraceae bacterium]|nr:single-stranded-DNA-specific exonuclease RecJ [Geobacteraceae bacterium]